MARGSVGCTNAPQAGVVQRVVMVGDGASDLETVPVVDLFIGFGGFTAREKVRREAAAFVTSLSAVPGLV